MPGMVKERSEARLDVLSLNRPNTQLAARTVVDAGVSLVGEIFWDSSVDDKVGEPPQRPIKRFEGCFPFTVRLQ